MNIGDDLERKDRAFRGSLHDQPDERHGDGTEPPISKSERI